MDKHPSVFCSAVIVKAKELFLTSTPDSGRRGYDYARDRDRGRDLDRDRDDRRRDVDRDRRRDYDRDYDRDRRFEFHLFRSTDVQSILFPRPS